MGTKMRWMILRGWQGAFVVASLCASAAAWGGPPPLTVEDPWADEPAPTLDEARRAFVEGRQLMEAQRWEEASERFTFALRARDTPGLRYYVAYCFEKQDRLLEALDAYQKAADQLEESPAPDVAELIPVAMERVRAALPHLVIHGLKPGARVLLDGKVPETPDSTFIDPGPHEIIIDTPGYEAYAERVEATRGQTILVQAKLVPLPDPHAVPEEGVRTPSEKTPRPSKAQSIVFWSSVGVGGVGLATGIAGTVVLLSSGSQVRDAEKRIDEEAPNDASPCFDPSGALAEACDDLQRGRDRQDTGKILTIAGYSALAVGVTGALVAKFLWPKSSLEVGASPLRRGGFLSVGGSF